MAWNDVFPIFTDDYIDNYHINATPTEKMTFDELFDVEEICNIRPESHILSVSLYWKHDTATDPDLPALSREALQASRKLGLVRRYQPWDHYIQPLLGARETLKIWTKEHKIRVYLANDLKFLIPDLLPHCEVYVMKSNSVRHNPGAMWRFEAMSDTTAETVTIIDSDMMGVPGFHLEASARMKELELGAWRFLNVGESVSQKVVTYRPMWGCSFGVNLTKLRVNWNDILKSFVWAVNTNQFQTSAVHPTSGPTPIFGSQWPDYGYDEFFLLAAAYPRLAQLGFLTYVESVQSSYCFPLDIEYATWANANSLLAYVKRGRFNFPNRNQHLNYEDVSCC